MKIYFEDLNNCAKDFDCWYSMLSNNKKSRVDRIKDNHKKKILILSDHLARLSVSEFTGISQSEISFSYNSHGKPILPQGSPHFNVSHSGDYVVCCISDKPCGIDIEVIREVNLNSAKRFCTENELDYINSSQNKNEALLYIWTRKEAYFKSVGCGIATILSSVDVLTTDGFKTKVTEKYVLSTFELPKND